MRTPIVGGLLAALAASCHSGCGDSGAPPAGSAPVASVSAPADTGDAAQAAVTALTAGIQQGRLEAIWEFFPSDFQDDLNGLIHQFADKMDAELWDKSVALFRKLARVLKSQKQFLAAAEPAPSRAIGRPKGTGKDTAPPQPIADWVKVADMLETVLAGDLASLERLKTADGGRLLATIGGDVFKQMRGLSRRSPDDDIAYHLARLGELHVSVVHAMHDAATLKFEAEGDTPLIARFVIHKGKWVPESMENDWHHHMGNARAWLSSALDTEAMGEVKPRYLAMLNAADSAIDRMAAAKTKEEFAVAGQQASVPLYAMLFGLPPAADPSDNEAQPVDSKEVVTVVVAGTLDEDAQDALRERIKAVTDDANRAAAEITGDDETSTFKIGPVADVEAFAKRLGFLEITGVDVGTRTITANLRK
jgi:hypothetical protein